MKNIKPNLSEVKEHFKDAEKINSIYGSVGVFNGNVHFEDDCFFCNKKEDSGYLALWKEGHGYAKILTYKTKQMKITKSQIKELDNGTTTVRELFPSVFETVIKKGKWHKSKELGGSLFYITTTKTNDDNCYSGYGFENNTFYEERKNYWNCDNVLEATNQEVEEALKSELIRLGVKDGAYFNCLESKKPLKCYGCPTPYFAHYYIDDYIYFGGVKVYEKGVFARPSETITKSEAEKLLNKKII